MGTLTWRANKLGVVRTPALRLWSLSLLLLLLGWVGGSTFEPSLSGETKIYTSQGTHKDYFGHTVAVFGDVIVVGAYAANTVIPESGSAFSFQVNSTGNDTSWAERDFIAASQIYPHDYFGGSVSMWENTIVIGAYLDQALGSKSGSAFIFKLSGGKWKEKQKLTSMLSSSADYFGQDVAISDGHIVVGAYGHSDPASYYNGAAYVFERVHSSSKWTQQSFLSPSDTQDYQMFGYSVCIHNNTIVVGAYGDSTAGSNTGAVYIFRKMLSNSQPHRGRAVSASNMTVLLYEWVEIQKLLPGDPKSHANFGTSVALSQRSYSSIFGIEAHDSYDIVIGSSLATGVASVTGAAYVFRNDHSLWTQYAKLYAQDGVGDERFGSSVAVHGGFLAVGAPEDRSRGTDSGSAYIFELTTADRWTFQRKLIGNDTEPYDNFGSSCALHGTTLVIGAEKAFGAVDSSGAAYIFSADGSISKRISRSYFAEEAEQFVLLLAVLPLLLILLPLVVFSGAVYLNSVQKSSNGPIGSTSTADGTTGVPIGDGYSSSMTPLEEFASLHGSSSSDTEDFEMMNASLDTSTGTACSSTPFSLSASRHGLITRRSPAQQKNTMLLLSDDVVGSHSEDELQEPTDKSGYGRVNHFSTSKIFQQKEPLAIQDAIDCATEETSPMKIQETDNGFLLDMEHINNLSQKKMM